ncbi:hypothetical protein NLG97_g1278 [Lecanicillium saksenae]|uniref:Uncharacterized protein n=1 Tax=Lecanicillium saksenae TaxID=468837 RepID=A0ACC1R464_9HYPO|nr:hypothetical protein NLG97_g1278 [Lecanicillium saksenae]
MSSAPSSTEVMTEVLAAKGKGKERMTLQGPLDYELPTSPVTASSTTTSASASAIASSATVSREDSLASTLVSGAEPFIHSACSGAPFSGTGMKMFDIRIPRRLEQRFAYLQNIYSPALYSHILGKRGFLSSRRTKKIDTGACDFSMKWKYLGESEETAKLYIVIQCGAGVGKKVRRFFSQDHVVEDLGTDFQVKVIEASIRRLMVETTAAVVWRHKPAGDIGWRHYAQEMRRLSMEDDGDGGSDSEEISDSTDGDADEDGLINGSDWSIVLQDKDKHALEPKEKVMKAHFNQFLGVVSHDSFRDDSMKTNHDWALVYLPPQETLPNLMSGSRELSLLSGVSVSLPDTVAVLTSRGLQYGKLVQKHSALLMSPGQRAAQTLDFIPHADSHLLRGDSGAWVVNPTNGHVYGHLVAVDAFGEGYVIPMHETLQSIQAYLVASNVYLPSSEELQKAEKEAFKKKVEEETKATLEEKAKKDRGPCLHFKDALGRKYSFPYRLCTTWPNMEELIKQAFDNVEELAYQVHEGWYDLLGPNQEIILPSVWEKVIEPEWSVTMSMWPVDRLQRAGRMTPHMAAAMAHRAGRGGGPMPPPPPPGMARGQGLMPPGGIPPGTVPPEGWAQAHPHPKHASNLPPGVQQVFPDSKKDKKKKTALPSFVGFFGGKKPPMKK